MRHAGDPKSELHMSIPPCRLFSTHSATQALRGTPKIMDRGTFSTWRSLAALQSIVQLLIRRSWYDTYRTKPGRHCELKLLACSHSRAPSLPAYTLHSTMFTMYTNLSGGLLNYRPLSSK